MPGRLTDKLPARRTYPRRKTFGPDPLTSATSTIPAQKEPTVAAGQFLRRLFEIVFYAQFLLVSILTVFLTTRGFLSARRHHFHPAEWYPPLLSATGGAAVAAFVLQRLIQCSPSKALRAAFWLSPVLVLGVGVLLSCMDSVVGLVIGVISIISAVSLALYGCWVNTRFEYASEIISVSTASVSSEISCLVGFSVTVAVLYSGFTVCGIGGATAVGTTLDVAFILIELLSLTWTMHVIKNALQATVSRVEYLRLVCGVQMDCRTALRETARYLMGSVSIGSVFVPVSGVIRGSARAISTVAGDADEFLFSCADCYSGVASALTSRANRWGFVHVGVYNKEFAQASKDTWDMFRRAEIEVLIDSDLTGVVCFLCGVTGGAVSSLIAGSWALAVHKSYATELSLYAFLIGYFMCRVAVAGAQACVSAHYVAYSENPQSPQVDPIITVRLQEMKRHQA
ncbi:CTL-like protein DDB_G0274487 [Punica granatum]|uniref:Choline transporter-like protein n=2 Tax=Punica granatum TaxID=22663 RepID=A0A218X281_PUNGR|nr:CTL-like protein DDB_G0274487 [Punica granatum]OWM78839.1 hypothetical protein CDL15_Pgr003010 [Punica granatum]PKI34838.1 hypothetical protein CRG98_044765 [Punica granatum]